MKVNNGLEAVRKHGDLIMNMVSMFGNVPAPVKNEDETLKIILKLLQNKDEEFKKLQTEVSKLNKVLAYRGKKADEAKTAEDYINQNYALRILDSKAKKG